MAVDLQAVRDRLEASRSATAGPNMDRAVYNVAADVPELLAEVARLRAAVAEAEARGYQRAIDALREINDLLTWWQAKYPERYLDLLQIADAAAYLEASAQTAIRSGESADE